MVLEVNASEDNEIVSIIEESAERKVSNSGSSGSEAPRALKTSRCASVDGDVPVPWWYTPKRLLVRPSCYLPYVGPPSEA